ncbi:prolipoprotein diacylglyceryl transferase [Mycoplasmatota bacterium]|nr:prolipoprotein diacylglyceryl transferase [Mycoplasmatota bacterium]
MMKTMNEFWQKHKQGIILYGTMAFVFILIVILATATQDGYPYNNLAIDTDIKVGNFEFDVAWYAVFILTGIMFGAALAYFEFKRFKIDTDILFDGLLYTVPLAIIGARLWWVLFNLGSIHSFGDIFAIQDGGLAIHGAIIVVFLFLIVFTKWKKISYWWMLDLVAPGFLIGQTLGRWGNFMNGELYGPAVDHLNFLPDFISEQMYIGGSYHAPTFLYESLWNFTGLIVLLIIRRKKILKVGDAIGLYFMWYGLIRIPMELLRFQGDPSDPLPLPWLDQVTAWYEMASLWTSVLLVLGGLSILVFKRIFKKDLPYYNELALGNK